MLFREVKFVVAACLALSGVATQGWAAEGGKDIVATATAAGSFKTLTAAIQAGGLAETLKGTGPFTVFAPTDDAFAKLPAGTVESLLRPENKAQLVSLLTYHVVPGKVMAAQVVKLNAAATVNGQQVDIRVAEGKVRVDQSTVIQADVACSNGVIHVIDTVLLPPANEKSSHRAKLVRGAVFVSWPTCGR